MSILCNFMSMVLFLTLACSVTPLQNSTMLGDRNFDDITNETNYRLPSDVWPTYYIIKLAPNLSPDEFSFAGESSINIFVLGECKMSITLHAKNLNIDEEYTTLVDFNNKSLKPVAHSIDNVTDFLTVFFETPVPVGSYWLNFKYTGWLRDDFYGIFRTSYINENEENIWLAATQFSPIYAREAFPCFDEPAIKAKFQLSIKHFDNYTAISNMPVISRTNDDENSQIIWTHFNVTPIMSTYLIAFVVSDLKNLSNKDGNFSCWTQKNKIHNCRYAVDIGQKALKALEDYMGNKFTIPKIDNVVIPHYTDAMENWGIIVYSDKRLLYQEGVTSTLGKQLIVLTISHELAHEWFGNMVTPALWDNVWLSEGLSSYFEYFIADKVEPSSRLLDLMVVKILQGNAFVSEANIRGHPMTVKVNRTSDIRKMFDFIAYNKAPCVIRMISHVLTEKVFQDGLKEYTKNKAFDVATPNDLLNAFVTASDNFSKDIPIKEFFDSWKDQAGYPVINVNRLVTSTGYVSINQTRFPPKLFLETPSTEQWWIPINYATQNDPNFHDTRPSHWVRPSQSEQKVPLKLDSNQWFIVNKQQTGYYRVNYDDENWSLIADYLDSPNYSKIHVLNRAQLLDDSFKFAKYEYVNDFSVFLNLSRYLEREVDYIPWYPAFKAFDELDRALKKTETHKLFKTYVLKLIRKAEYTLGYHETSGDDDLTKLNRVSVIKWACKMGSKKCAIAMRAGLIKHVRRLTKISTDLLEDSICEGIRTAHIRTWKKTFKLYFPAKDEESSRFILRALACSSNPRIIEYYLMKLIEPDFTNQIHISVPEFFFIIAESSEAGFDIILDFMAKNVATLSEIFGEWLESPEILYVIEDIKATDAQIEKLIALADEIPTVTKELANKFKVVANYLATKSSKWLSKYELPIRSFLLSQNL